MKAIKKYALILVLAGFIASVLSSCSDVSPVTTVGSPQTIPYSESRIAEFSKEFKETTELYIESNNGLTKTVIDIPSGNSYEETTEGGKLEKTYFLRQSDGTVPAGVYNLFEKNQLKCYYPIEGDATIDLYDLLAGMNSTRNQTVQVSYDGANRVEKIRYGENTSTIIFWGETTIPLSAGRKNDMEDFMINFNVVAKQIPDVGMKTALKNGLKGYSLYIPPNPYA